MIDRRMEHSGTGRRGPRLRSPSREPRRWSILRSNGFVQGSFAKPRSVDDVSTSSRDGTCGPTTQRPYLSVGLSRAGGGHAGAARGAGGALARARRGARGERGAPQRARELARPSGRRRGRARRRRARERRGKRSLVRDDKERDRQPRAAKRCRPRRKEDKKMVSRASGGEQSPARDDEKKETKHASTLFATGSGRASFELRIGGATLPNALTTDCETRPPADAR